MGKILQIRVSAWTYDEDEVTAAWPKLCALVWGELDRFGPVGMKHGVTELAQYLPDAVRFSNIDKNTRARLAPGVEKVTSHLLAMRSALESWDPRLANAISNNLEEALTNLEQLAPEYMPKP